MGTTSTRHIATIGDVARLAGVSRATVSRVMNGKKTVDPVLADRVASAAAELHYRPSPTARNLSLGRTETVAVSVPALANPMFQEILRGVTEGATRRGYRVLVSESSGSERQALQTVLGARTRCDALVLVSPRQPELDASFLAELAPVVVVNHSVNGPAPSVGVDYAAGVVDVATHLLSLGHRHLVFLAGPDRSEPNMVRHHALTELAAAHGVKLEVLSAGASIEAGYAAGEAVLATGATGVIAFNDLVAYGLLACLNELGVDVPGDISVAGFDDVALAKFAFPPITTAAVSYVDLGINAWRHLERLLGIGAAVRTPDLVPQLRVRASTGIARVRDQRTVRPATGRSEALPDPATSPTATFPTQARAVAPPSATSMEWQEAGSDTVLVATTDADMRIDVARAVTGTDLPPVHSPRPYLHPVRTLTGLDLTAVTPTDHRHQYGMSMPVASVNGTSYWGGRTYLEGRGPTLLPNHGAQLLVDSHSEGARLTQEIEWRNEHGALQLREVRTLEGAPLGPGAWVLRCMSTLTAADGEVIISSPSVAGRSGAGYGGLFWRLSSAHRTTLLASVGPSSEASLHGSREPWLAYVQERSNASAALVLVQHPRIEALPWFLRLETYPAAGPALAFDKELRLEAGESTSTALAGIAVDTAPDTATAAELAAHAWDVVS